MSNFNLVLFLVCCSGMQKIRERTFLYPAKKHWRTYVILHVKAFNGDMFNGERFKNYLRYLARKGQDLNAKTIVYIKI